MASGGRIQASTGANVKALFPPQGIDLTGDDLVYRRVVSATADLRLGTATGLIDTIVVQSRALVAGTAYTYDLYTGTDLKQPNGDAAAFRLIKYVAVVIDSGGDTSGVRIGGAASNEWIGFFVSAGDQQDIFPDGPPYQGGSPAGVTVSSSVKNLKVQNRSAVDCVVTYVIGGNQLTAGMWLGFGLWTYP